MNPCSPDIMKIFDEMNDEEETNDLSLVDGDVYSKQDCELLCANRDVLRELVKSMKEPLSCDEAIKNAIKVEKTWEASSLQLRADTLHNVWDLLKSTSRSFPLLKDDFSLFIDYFDFYSNVLLRLEDYKGWKPHGITLMVLSNHSFLFPMAAAVPAALAAGCSVIVIIPESMKLFFLFLQEIFSKACLPDGVFNVVLETKKTCSLLKKIDKIFFCGAYLSAQKFYSNTSVESFNFVCPNNTAAFILESADFDSAVDKIVSETWDKEEPFFAVSTVVIQESVYEEVFEKLKYKMNQCVIKNKHTLKFNNKIMSDRIQELISEAVLAGASVYECDTKVGRWSPTIIVNYQNQNINQDMPVLKLLLCRTAKEGVTLLNNCRYTLGVSVWSEISSQALEISSKLISPNVWINCHGTHAPSVPFQLSGLSGNCVLGGVDGILEFVSMRCTPSLELNDVNEELQKNVHENPDCGKILQVAVLAQQGFTTWQSLKDRRQFLKKIATSLKYSEGPHDIIEYYAHSQCIIGVSDTIASEEFFFVEKKFPFGVILLLVNANEIDKNSIVSLITPAITFGNAVIIVLKEDNVEIQMLIQNFVKVLPKNVISVIVGMHLGILLVSHPSVQALWLYNESTVSSGFLQTLKNHSARNVKRFWIVPKILPHFHHFFQKECVQTKIMWLPKIDEFP